MRSRSVLPQSRASNDRRLTTTGWLLESGRLDVAAFHVTFCLGVDRVHFYFHEVADGVWEPGGHTSALEIRRYRREPAELRSLADRIAGAFLSSLGMQLLPRDGADEVGSETSDG
jgi:hypothetical protein